MDFSRAQRNGSGKVQALLLFNYLRKVLIFGLVTIEVISIVGIIPDTVQLMIVMNFMTTASLKWANRISQP